MELLINLIIERKVTMNKNKSKKYIDIEKEEILNNRIFINEYNQHRLIIISITNQAGQKFKLLFDLTTDTIKNKTKHQS